MNQGGETKKAGREARFLILIYSARCGLTPPAVTIKSAPQALI
jgi:hypothetical protein